MTMPLKDYTTSVSVHKSVGEITAVLVKSGARGIGQEYDEDGRLIGVEFVVTHHGLMLRYALPVRTEAVLAVLTGQQVEQRYRTPEQAERVAWRILRDWLIAQLAIIETGMVEFPEVMFPYMRTDGADGTVYQQWISSQPALTAGGT